AVVFARPFVYPQFTLLAGLLTAVAVLGWCVYLRSGERPLLATATALAFAGFLVRPDEFALVVAVSAPLLLTRRVKDRTFLAATGALIVLAAIAAGIDRHAYQAEEWRLHQS